MGPGLRRGTALRTEAGTGVPNIDRDSAGKPA